MKAIEIVVDGDKWFLNPMQLASWGLDSRGRSCFEVTADGRGSEWRITETPPEEITRQFNASMSEEPSS